MNNKFTYTNTKGVKIEGEIRDNVPIPNTSSILRSKVLELEINQVLELSNQGAANYAGRILAENQRKGSVHKLSGNNWGVWRTK